jgi:hypothetical protein
MLGSTSLGCDRSSTRRLPTDKTARHQVRKEVRLNEERHQLRRRREAAV